MLLVAVSVVGVAACGNGATSSTPTSPRTPTPTTAATGPCAAVRQTTALTSVSEACQAVWRPYGVTKVPPFDLLATVPRAPRVANHTGGKVDDAAAQRYGQDSNNDSKWVQWAEANGQLSLLSSLNGPAAINGKVKEALAAGATVTDPDCDLYAQAFDLWPIDARGRDYFARGGAPTSGVFVLVATFGGPNCAVYAKYPDGHITKLADAPLQTVFGPGVEKREQPLGDIWFSDAGGNCQDGLGEPAEWCRR